MAKILIGCKLPHGLLIENPMNPEEKVQIKGLNKVEIIGATHATTEVDEELWKLWKATNKDFGPLKNGALFEAKDKASAKDKAKDTGKTGFEPMDPKDKKNGVTTADDKE